MKYIDDENSRAARCICCTGTSPSSLVYGTEKDILQGLSRIRSQGTAERVFLESNCSTGLIGDDVKGIAEEFGGPWPVYTMDSGGLKGSFEKGFARAFLRVVEEMKEESTIPASVNVLGLSEVYLKGREEGNEIRRILKGCGIRVISTPGCESSWHEIMEAPKASFNLVVRDELGLPAAKEMEKRFHIPYASVGLPYGFEGSRKWTEKVISLLSFGKAEPFLDQEKERAEEVLRKGNGLESLWGSLWFDEVLVAAPPSEALGIAEALRSEWIDTARLTVHLLSPSDRTCPLADEVRLVTEMMRISGRITKTGRMVLSSPAVMKRQDWNGFISLSFPAILPVPPTMNAPSPTFPTAVFEAPPCSMKNMERPPPADPVWETYKINIGNVKH